MTCRTQPASARTSSLIIITAATDATWLDALLPLMRRGAVATVLLLDPLSFGGTADSHGIEQVLTDLGISHYRLGKDFLDRPEARPGQQGHWHWRVSPFGRAIAVNQDNVQWKALAQGGKR